MEQVQSLAWERAHARDVAKKKKKEPITECFGETEAPSSGLPRVGYIIALNWE